MSDLFTFVVQLCAMIFVVLGTLTMVVSFGAIIFAMWIMLND